MARREELTDEQWCLIKPIFEKTERNPDSRQTTACGTRSLKWCALDSAFRRTVAGFAGAISAIPDLPSPFPSVG